MIWTHLWNDFTQIHWLFLLSTLYITEEIQAMEHVWNYVVNKNKKLFWCRWPIKNPLIESSPNLWLVSVYHTLRSICCSRLARLIIALQTWLQLNWLDNHQGLKLQSPTVSRNEKTIRKNYGNYGLFNKKKPFSFYITYLIWQNKR